MTKPTGSPTLPHSPSLELLGVLANSGGVTPPAAAAARVDSSTPVAQLRAASTTPGPRSSPVVFRASPKLGAGGVVFRHEFEVLPPAVQQRINAKFAKLALKRPQPVRPPAGDAGPAGQ